MVINVLLFGYVYVLGGVVEGGVKYFELWFGVGVVVFLMCVYWLW